MLSINNKKKRQKVYKAKHHPTKPKLNEWKKIRPEINEIEIKTKIC